MLFKISYLVKLNNKIKDFIEYNDYIILRKLEILPSSNPNYNSWKPMAIYFWGYSKVRTQLIRTVIGDNRISHYSISYFELSQRNIFLLLLLLKAVEL